MTLVALEQQSSKSIDLVLGSSFSLNPIGLFDLSDVDGTVVELQFNAPVEYPILYVELYDNSKSANVQTPVTADNFLYYVNNGLYNNSIIHRSVPGFVIQGGGFRTATTDGQPPIPVATQSPITNEPGNSNLRGTLAMAKLGGDPNSATSQWFINTNDNSGNLDVQNGGFTVFGKVLGTGMDLVDLIAQTDVINASALNPAFSDLPVWTAEDQQQYFTLVTSARELPNETSLMGFSIDSSNPTAVEAAINDEGDIVLSLKQPLFEPLTITLSATSYLDGSRASQSITLNESGSYNVYRFYNNNSGVHFYTPSKEEWLSVNNNPDWGYNYEGIAYQALGDQGTQLYRFYNAAKGYHFLSTSAEEAKAVVANSYGEGVDADAMLADPSAADPLTTGGWGYTYEGRSYRVSTEENGDAQTAVYRFFKPSAGVHFYSSSLDEVRNVISQSSGAQYANDLNAAQSAPLLENGWGYRLEGLAWYAANSL